VPNACMTTSGGRTPPLTARWGLYPRYKRTAVPLLVLAITVRSSPCPNPLPRLIPRQRRDARQLGGQISGTRPRQLAAPKRISEAMAQAEQSASERSRAQVPPTASRTLQLAHAGLALWAYTRAASSVDQQTKCELRHLWAGGSPSRRSRPHHTQGQSLLCSACNWASISSFTNWPAGLISGSPCHACRRSPSTEAAHVWGSDQKGGAGLEGNGCRQSVPGTLS